MRNWYTADLHFGHEKIARTRGFSDFSIHDNEIAFYLNKCVKPDDRLFIVGDFAWKRPSFYRSWLSCKNITFVKGNHDCLECKLAFGAVHDIYTQRKFGYFNEPLIMCHYPMAFWDRSHYGSYHIYGHIHSQREAYMDELWPERRSMDVGVDNAKRLFGEYRPFSHADLLAQFDGRAGHDSLEYYKQLRGEW